MKVLNIGSINMDLVFNVPHITVPGETITSFNMTKSAGGKGANQSVALAKAGVDVYHAGTIGQDGFWLRDLLSSYGVNTQLISVYDGPTGQAFIQLSEQGQNSIVLFPGGNHHIGHAEIDKAFVGFGKGDILLLQNEILNIPYIMEKAHSLGLEIWFNPAPMSDEVFSYPLSLLSMIVVNEIEGAMLANLPVSSRYSDILEALVTKYPECEIILTVGKDGALYGFKDVRAHEPILDYPVVDTTGAGDTFIGYFLASRIKGYSTKACLANACKASSIKVSRSGAMGAMPLAHEVF